MATLQDLKDLFAERRPHDVAIEISGFTGFRTTDINELTEDEINHLYAVHRPKEKDLEKEFDAFKNELILKAWRSKILSMAEKAGLKEPGCFHKFNNWMLLKSKFNKHLNAHDLEELKQLHIQICAAMSNKRKSAERPLTEAWWKKGATIKNWN